jgi:hypothetical protein
MKEVNDTLATFIYNMKEVNDNVSCTDSVDTSMVYFHEDDIEMGEWLIYWGKRFCCGNGIFI